MERRIASERMAVLFTLAEKEAVAGREARARRYIELARKIGMRYNVRVAPEFRRRFCKKCLAYLLPGTNARVRVGRGRLVVTCLACGTIQRMPYRAEKELAQSVRGHAQ
jgi:ribonuclease P protein subunit RPR2